MSLSTSVVAELLQALPDLRPQIYFKSSLTALSHAMEDQVLADTEPFLVIASFQQERFYRQEAHRYRRIAKKTSQVYVLSAPETNFRNENQAYELIAFEPTDALSQEWHLVVIGRQAATCLICRECPIEAENPSAELESARRFEGIWSFEQRVSQQAAEILLQRILVYRPELTTKIEQARRQFLGTAAVALPEQPLQEQDCLTTNPAPFVERLVTHLQANQYKLIKAYRSLAAKEQQERLVRSITVAIRRSLNPDEILQVAAQQLGETLGACRCLVYCCREEDATVHLRHEFLRPGVASLQGKTLEIQAHPLLAQAIAHKESLIVEDPNNSQLAPTEELKQWLKRTQIHSALLVPILSQGRVMGAIELHHCHASAPNWQSHQIELVEAIAIQIGVALTQAQAFANLEDLNEQLAALDRTRSNLVAITGHELRTPLSTIQVCLESLASEPEMSPELRQVMLNTALDDAERMRKLIQDFLTLSQLESGRVEWNPEPLSLQECIDLSISNIRARIPPDQRPRINLPATDHLPMVRVDGEWLVEVLAKLLDNACKFTSADGEVTLSTERKNDQMIEITIADNGRGIEPNRLEQVFDRFYQEEGALQRTTSGTGLGLAICRQIVQKWGGEIWAESAGKDYGTQFHFTVPVVENSSTQEVPRKRGKKA